jgi:hypothetical protein
MARKGATVMEEIPGGQLNSEQSLFCPLPEPDDQMVRPVIKQAWEIYKKHWMVLIITVLTPVLPALIIRGHYLAHAELTWYGHANQSGHYYLLPLFLLDLFSWAAVLRCVSLLRWGESAEPWEIWRATGIEVPLKLLATTLIITIPVSILSGLLFGLVIGIMLVIGSKTLALMVVMPLAVIIAVFFGALIKLVGPFVVIGDQWHINPLRAIISLRRRRFLSYVVALSFWPVVIGVPLLILGMIPPMNYTRQITIIIGASLSPLSTITAVILYFDLVAHYQGFLLLRQHP